MQNTTVPMTTGGKSLRRGLRKRAKAMATKPPTNWAPMTAAMPSAAPMELRTGTKAKEAPVITGRPEPTRPKRGWA